MTRHFIFLALLCFVFQDLRAQPIIQLQTWATGFVRPVDIASAGDERLFIVEQRGIIHILNAQGQRLPSPFLNIQSRVNSAASERGLLGLVFHPNYAENGYFYVNYTNTSGNTRISRFRVSASDPNVADPDSELILIGVNQPFSNHNAGDLNFGPDGYLYFGLGDGGSGGDPQNFGQNRQSFLGKMIRIDVNNGSPYAIPATNPFINDPTTLDEIWAVGLRNPWRFSFDRLTGDMWIADVGQNAWEEIDFQPASSTGGMNYGWRCYEGNNAYNTSGCQPASAYTFPIHVYPNNFNNGCSVTGGFVYRGNEFPDLYGHYIYTDYCSGRIWSLTPNGSGGWTNRQLLQGATNNYVSFGEDDKGELYLAALASGTILRVRELCSPFQVTGQVTDQSCAGQVDGAIALNIENPNATHTITWSNGAITPSISNLAPGTYTVSVTNSNTCTRTIAFTVGAADPLPAPALALGQTTLCEGDSAVIIAPQAPAGLGYRWFRDGQLIPGASEDNLIVDEPGAYQLAYVDQSGCESPKSNVLNIVFETTSGQPPIQVQGNELSVPDLDNFIAYQWFLNGQPIQGANGSTYTALESGNYTVEAVTLAGCTVVWAPVNVVVSRAVERFGLQRFTVTPNPVSGMLRIDVQVENAAYLSLRLMDASGRTVWFTRDRMAGSWTGEVDMSGFPSGVYALVLQRGKQVLTSRQVVKQ